MKLYSKYGYSVLYGITQHWFPFPYIKIVKKYNRTVWLDWFIKEYMDSSVIHTDRGAYGIHSALLRIPQYTKLIITCRAYAVYCSYTGAHARKEYTKGAITYELEEYLDHHTVAPFRDSTAADIENQQLRIIPAVNSHTNGNQAEDITLQTLKERSNCFTHGVKVTQRADLLSSWKHKKYKDRLNADVTVADYYCKNTIARPNYETKLKDTPQ